MAPDEQTAAESERHLIGDRYELAEVIGRGAMGEVRAGRDRRLERDVAVKLLRAQMAEEPAIRTRFEDEARLAARLVHPHVVAVFDCGEDGGVPYLVMERLSGRTLADDIATGPLDCELVRTIGVQVLGALGAAHAAGIVHRDVKPGNVLVATPGCWKVGDFGIAKSLEVSDQNLTVAGMIIGTPAYLAPERLAGGQATVSSDLYATGVVLYEALTGRRPVAEGAPLEALLTATPVPVGELRPDTPAPMAAAVMRAMARDPAARFRSADEMSDALQRRAPGLHAADTVAVAAQPAMAATQAFTQPLPPVVIARPGSTSGVLRLLRDRRGRVLLAISGVVAILVLLVVLVAITALPDDHGTSGTTSPTTQATPAGPTLGVPAPLDAALKRLEGEVQP